jgi:hypothetical protein
VQYVARVNFVEAYEHVILTIVAACPGPDKFAHMSAGLGFWLFVAVVLRKPLASWPPMAIVIALEGANEVVDRIAKGGWFWSDTLADVVVTLFWPALFFIALRLMPSLGVQRINAARATQPG